MPYQETVHRTVSWGGTGCGWVQLEETAGLRGGEDDAVDTWHHRYSDNTCTLYYLYCIIC